MQVDLHRARCRQRECSFERDRGAVKIARHVAKINAYTSYYTGREGKRGDVASERKRSTLEKPLARHTKLMQRADAPYSMNTSAEVGACWMHFNQCASTVIPSRGCFTHCPIGRTRALNFSPSNA